VTLLLAVLPIVAVAQGGIDNSLPRDTSHLLVSAVDANPDSALATALQALQGDPLGLSQAIHEAQQHATAAGEAEARLRAAEATVLREKGAFDPQIFGELSRSSSRLPADSPFLGANPLDTRETAASAGASIRLPIGTELGVSAQVLREETNSAYASLNPQYDASGSLDLRQPLLKGFGPSAHSALSAARRDLAAARARRGDALLGVQADAETAYWGLYAAERDYAVQQLIRDSAKALLEQARLRAEAGLVGPEQVANARVFLAEQEQAVLDQRDRLDAASDRMSTLLGRRPAEGDLRFRTLDEPPGDFPSEPADTLVGRALRRNLVLQGARGPLGCPP
jgi:outer membrane protein TolC